MAMLDRTKANPWVLKTPPGTSEYTMHVDEKDGVRVLVVPWGRLFFSTMRAASMTFTQCSKLPGIGSSLAGRMSKNQRRKER